MEIPILILLLCLSFQQASSRPDSGNLDSTGGDFNLTANEQECECESAESGITCSVSSAR